jgi:hypothetical protein
MKHLEVMDEILSIQQYAIGIASNNIIKKLDVFKERVDPFTLDYLSSYFQTSILPKDELNNRLLVVKSDNCQIFIEQENE